MSTRTSTDLRNHADSNSRPETRGGGNSGLVFKAHILLYDSTLGLGVIKKKKKDNVGCYEAGSPIVCTLVCV